VHSLFAPIVGIFERTLAPIVVGKGKPDPDAADAEGGGGAKEGFGMMPCRLQQSAAGKGLALGMKAILLVTAAVGVAKIEYGRQRGRDRKERDRKGRNRKERDRKERDRKERDRKKRHRKERDRKERDRKERDRKEHHRKERHRKERNEGAAASAHPYFRSERKSAARFLLLPSPFQSLARRYGLSIADIAPSDSDEYLFTEVFQREFSFQPIKVRTGNTYADIGGRQQEFIDTIELIEENE
jgi:hypothetical protein